MSGVEKDGEIISKTLCLLAATEAAASLQIVTGLLKCADTEFSLSARITMFIDSKMPSAIDTPFLKVSLRRKNMVTDNDLPLPV